VLAGLLGLILLELAEATGFGFVAELPVPPLVGMGDVVPLGEAGDAAGGAELPVCPIATAHIMHQTVAPSASVLKSFISISLDY
jgi:hypothetical protein